MTQRSQVPIQPLQRGDPPMLGDVMLRGRLASSDAGVVFAGQLVDEPVAVVMLSEGAEADSFARARFEEAGAALSDTEPGGVLASERGAEVAPWFAVPAGDGWVGGIGRSESLLAAVTLADVAPVGQVNGPEFRPHWFRRRGAGRWRIWPLPWPASLTAAARWTLVAAFALMVAIASVALWIAVLIFHTQPPAPRPPQVNRTTLPPPAPMTLPNPSHKPSPAPGHSTPPRTSRGTGGVPIPPIV
ncbi:MAG: hypothetical protein QOD35_2250 [Nocardioidaceae bacterium]|nr:hypothetical protein [Nocardioidaceae bacterium]